MYDYIKGKLTEKTATYIVVEAGGVGYNLAVSLYTYTKLKDMAEAKVLTYLAIKEDSHVLFGFADEDERRMFKLLISVNGVGTGTARLMLSSLPATELIEAIATGSVAALKNIKGIGEKTAQRIIIDLKDKIKKTDGVVNILLPLNNTIKEEALSALVTLGFAKPVAAKTLDKLLQTNQNLTVESLIRAALNTL
jgi:Holliday junction DNA helicase RuvA